MHPTLKLIWPWQALFLGARLLAGVYFAPVRTLVCHSGVLMSDVLATLLIPAVPRWRVGDRRAGQRILMRSTANTVVSAGTIRFSVVNLAQRQAVGGDSAPLLAAMNNTRMIAIPMRRLKTYGSAFIFVTCFGIVR